MRNLALATLVSSIALAQTPSAPGPPPSSEQEPAAPPAVEQPALTAADVSAFIDGIVPLQLSRADIAGAVVAVVKDGQPLFAKGYGYADVEKKTPVTTSTLFRIGSVAKLLTWTAVMQQVEAEKLDLEEDVNRYIDFTIPPAFGKPITLKNLMTHTPGFEDVGKGLFVGSPSDIAPLRTYLVEHLPRRIFPPGEVPAYSNYGVTLAGYIVERVSGIPLHRYLAERVIEPLGMKSTTFAQPLPPEMEQHMSKGYKNASDPPIPFELIQAWPAGSTSASADDMARFMLAYLGSGRLGDAQILKPATVQVMHTRAFGASPALSGMAHGFYEETRNGHRIVGHAGDTQAFHTDLHLVPGLNLGFFVSYNSTGRAPVSARSELWEGFFDRYFPAPARSAAAATVDPKSLAGSYRVSRRVESGFLKLLAAVGQLVVAPQEDGTLVIDGLNRNDGQPRRWKADGATAFRALDGADRVAFERDAAGGVTLAVDFPFMVFKRVPWYLDKRLILGVVAASVGLLLMTVVFWPVSAMIRRRYGRKLDLPPAEARLRLWTRLVGLYWLAVLVAWGVFLAKANGDYAMASRRSDGLLLTLEGATLIACLASVIPLLHAWRAWANRRWIWSRVYETLVALACVALVWLAVWGNLAKLGTRY